jgi:hypothetical protein
LGKLELSVFWHLTRPSDFLLHNAFLAKGWVTPPSAALPGAVSYYQAMRAPDPKEIIWETARLAINPALPTRLGSLYFFDDHEEALRAKNEWFSQEARLLVRAHLPEMTVRHRADANLLERAPREWEAAAAAYWRGTMTDTPKPEVLVAGPVWFPDWEAPPFGRRS